MLIVAYCEQEHYSEKQHSGTKKAEDILILSKTEYHWELCKDVCTLYQLILGKTFKLF